MKTFPLFCLLSLVLLLSSCEKLFPEKEDDSTLNGSTDIPLNKTGNTFSSYVSVNGTYADITAAATITKSEDGVATVRVKANLKDAPDLEFINNLIPSKYIDSQGNVDVEGKVKATDEGFLDYTNADGKPFVMVRYDCAVGDTYKLAKSDGTTITRKVTAKSTDDDFSYGFMMIKTIMVEQDSRIPGIQKIVYRFNHKFGIVYAEAVAQDGSKAGVGIYAKNY